MHWLALFVSGCAAPDVPPVGPALPFDASGTHTLALRHLPARLSLPATNLPAALEVRDTFELGPPARTERLDATRTAWIWSAPFPTSRNAERFAPPGMRVTADGAPVAFDMSPFVGGHTGWRVKDGELVVVLADAAREGATAPPAVTVVNPGVALGLQRLDPSRSGLSPVAHAAYRLTLRRETREGLLLPAPSSAEWDVTVPVGARFVAWPALVPTPVPAGTSDGATVRLEARDGDAVLGSWDHALVASEATLFGKLFRGEPRFDTWEVDLSSLAGRAVTLRLSTEPGASPDLDYVFVGAPAVTGAPVAPPRRVVVIGLDTTRADHLGVYGYDRDTSPEIDAFAASGAVFDRAWTPAPRTRPSFRSSTTGRGALDAVGATTIGQVFSAHGFATAGIVANIHLNPRFGFDAGYDLWHLDPFADASAQVDRTLAFLADHADQDAFVFLHIMDPHLVYAPPPEVAARFVTDPDPGYFPEYTRWDVLKWQEQGLLTDRRKAHVTGLYDGEIAWASQQLGRLFDALGDQALVVVHTDHGEELWDHGGFEHNHTLYDELVKAAFIVRPPDGSARGVRIDEPVTLADIAPTLYDWAGFTDTPPTDGRSLRPLITGADPGGWDRPVPLGHLMYDVEQWGVVWRDHKYIISTDAGKERLHDLRTDPGETRNIAGRQDLGPWRDALARAHGMPVGPGWRVDVKLNGEAPLVWTLPEPCVGAGVIDPEAAREGRANLVWGERPKHLPEEVATVAVEDGGRVLRITPGSFGRGTLWVRFDHEVGPGGTIERGGVPELFYAGHGDRWWVRSDELTLTVRPGTVFEPPLGEEARMRGLADAAGSDIELLRALGYVGGGH